MLQALVRQPVDPEGDLSHHKLLFERLEVTLCACPWCVGGVLAGSCSGGWHTCLHESSHSGYPALAQQLLRQLSFLPRLTPLTISRSFIQAAVRHIASYCPFLVHH